MSAEHCDLDAHIRISHPLLLHAEAASFFEKALQVLLEVMGLDIFAGMVALCRMLDLGWSHKFLYRTSSSCIELPVLGIELQLISPGE